MMPASAGWMRLVVFFGRYSTWMCVSWSWISGCPGQLSTRYRMWFNSLIRFTSFQIHTLVATSTALNSHFKTDEHFHQSQTMLERNNSTTLFHSGDGPFVNMRRLKVADLSFEFWIRHSLLHITSQSCENLRPLNPESTIYRTPTSVSASEASKCRLTPKYQFSKYRPCCTSK